jgi:hypothetical protein
MDTAVSLESLGDGISRRFRTKSLFWEWKFINAAITPVYNLSRRDHDNTLSMYNIYMSFDTEYEAAIRILGNWDHWESLCGCAVFKPYLEKWRTERKIREEAMAHRILVEAAEGGNVTAAKTILIDSKKVANVGRPTNQQVEKAAKAQAELDAFLVHSIRKKV